MHDYLREMNNEVLSKYDCMTVAQLHSTPDEAKVFQSDRAKEKQLNMVFQFDVVHLGHVCDERYDTDSFGWTLPEFKTAQLQSQRPIAGPDAWTTTFLEIHDQARSTFASLAISTDTWCNRERWSRGCVLQYLEIFIYQAQEMGMMNIPQEQG